MLRTVVSLHLERCAVSRTCELDFLLSFKSNARTPRGIASVRCPALLNSGRISGALEVAILAAGEPRPCLHLKLSTLWL